MLTKKKKKNTKHKLSNSLAICTFRSLDDCIQAASFLLNQGSSSGVVRPIQDGCHQISVIAFPVTTRISTIR